MYDPSATTDNSGSGTTGDEASTDAGSEDTSGDQATTDGGSQDTTGDEASTDGGSEDTTGDQASTDNSGNNDGHIFVFYYNSIHSTFDPTPEAFNIPYYMSLYIYIYSIFIPHSF